MPTFAPWAYSKIKAFETCPKQFYHLKVAKDYTEPPSEHLSYGNEVHKACEKFVKEDEPLPPKFRSFKPVLDALAKKPGEKHAELKLGLNADLRPCKFFGKDVWWRGVVDLLIHDGDRGWVIDYKTGKARYADPGQLELMALATFAHYPHVKEIRAALIFLVAEEMIRKKYTRDDIEPLWAKWIKRVNVAEAAMQANVFNPKPSGLCTNHCAVLECPHNGRG